MADHLWFIPVSSGNTLGEAAAAFPIAPTRDLTNVQWNFSVFPVGQEPPAEVSCLSYKSVTRFTMGQEAINPIPARLNDCYGSWTWRSCAEDSTIITGGQLAVGTVFSRELIAQHGDDAPIAYSWNTVEVFAKYRVDDKTKLDNIFLVINDGLGNFYPNPATSDIAPYVSGTWRVVGTRNRNHWQDWDNDNLRATLTFQGTTVAANAGLVTVDVEWFAFRLSQVD